MRIANRKLNILNIIYEISRIQFLLQQMYLRENFIKAKRMGIKLDLKPIKYDSLNISKMIILLIINKFNSTKTIKY